MDNFFTLISVQPIIKTNDLDSQWLHYEKLLTKAINQNKQNDYPTFITLPEYALGNKESYNEKALDTLESKIASFAHEHHVNIIAGSHAHKIDGVWFNRAWLFEDNGQTLHYYDKKHLFNFELKNNITPGTTNGVFSVKNFKIQILICSDLWFPEEIRNLLHEKIDLIIVPAMAVVQNEQFVDYGRTLWHNLAQTRSKENVIPLVVSDWAEQPVRGGSYTCGSSCIIDPSQRWQTDEEKINYFNYLPSKSPEGFITSIISNKKIKEYQIYRHEVGLLPND